MLLDLCQRVSNILERREAWVDCVFSDSQKALDAGTHNMFIEKLEIQSVVRGEFPE